MLESSTKKIKPQNIPKSFLVKLFVLWLSLFAGLLGLVPEAKAVASGYGLQRVAKISHTYSGYDIAYLWHPVAVGNRMFIGSYTWQESPTDTADLRIYYADPPYTSFSTTKLTGSADHESARPHVLNGELFFITEGELNKAPLVYRPGNSPGSSVSGGVRIGTNAFLLAATYFDSQALFGWSDYTGGTNNQVDGTRIYNANGGQWKSFYEPEIATFHMPVFNGYLYLIGYDAGRDASTSNNYGKIIRVDSNGAKTEINVGGAQGCYQGVEYNGSLYVGCGSRNIGTGAAAIWRLEGNALVKSASFSGDINNFGSLAVHNNRLYASGVKSNGRSEVMVFDGSSWQTILTQTDFKNVESDAGSASGLNQPSSMLVVANSELYLIDTSLDGSSGNRYGPSYLFKISTPNEPPPSNTTCNLNFNPASIELGGAATFSWEVTGSVTYAFLACNQAGGAEITSFIQDNPSGSLPNWTPTAAGTEICYLYLNGGTEPTCQSNSLTITSTDPDCAGSTCVGNYCWDGTQSVYGTKTEGCATCTANNDPKLIAAISENPPQEITYLTWNATNASKLQVQCEGLISVPLSDIDLSSGEWQAKAIAKGEYNKEANAPDGFPFWFTAGNHGRESCTFYPTNNTDNQPGTPCTTGVTVTPIVCTSSNSDSAYCRNQEDLPYNGNPQEDNITKYFFYDPPELTAVINNTMSLMLKIMGGLAIIAFVIAGIMFLTSRGNPERIEIAKRYFKYIVIGVALGLIGLILIKTIELLMG